MGKQNAQRGAGKIVTVLYQNNMRFATKHAKSCSDQSSHSLQPHVEVEVEVGYHATPHHATPLHCHMSIHFSSVHCLPFIITVHTLNLWHMMSANESNTFYIHHLSFHTPRPAMPPLFFILSKLLAFRV